MNNDGVNFFVSFLGSFVLFFLPFCEDLEKERMIFLSFESFVQSPRKIKKSFFDFTRSADEKKIYSKRNIYLFFIEKFKYYVLV
jgi:hypothetical protein